MGKIEKIMVWSEAVVLTLLILQAVTKKTILLLGISSIMVTMYLFVIPIFVYGVIKLVTNYAKR